MVFQRRTDMPKPVAAPAGSEMQRTMGGRGGGRGGSTGLGLADKTLRVTFRPSESAGLRIAAMDDASPLKTMGLKGGDLITGVNGKTSNLRTELTAAIEALQSNGTPVELTVDRKGKKETIKWTEKLPMTVQQTAPPQAPARGGARRGG
jgi:S1-C subfamily serine protease